MKPHLKSRKKNLRRWMLFAAVAAALAAGVASARILRECSDCTPCACAPGGGYILCCNSYAC